MNYDDAVVVAAFIAKLRARPDASGDYYRRVIAGWEQRLRKLREENNDTKPGRESE